jgi:hypothetical protein
LMEIPEWRLEAIFFPTLDSPPITPPTSIRYSAYYEFTQFTRQHEISNTGHSLSFKLIASWSLRACERVNA